MVKDKRIPFDECMKMSIREIRKTREYGGLTPMGKQNDTGKYRFGNKSYLNKRELCKALDNPTSYHKKIEKMKKQKKNAGPRKRSTRQGDCPKPRNNKVCSGSHAHKGLTTSGKHCCYKKQQSEKVAKKRVKARDVRKKAAAKKVAAASKKRGSKKSTKK